MTLYLPSINLRRSSLVIGGSIVALLFSLALIKWEPAHASVPGSAGDGVVNPAFGSYGDSVSIDVPDYYDLEPQLKLVYSSGSGNDIAGVGWGINVDSYIERMSPGGGTPRYNATDVYHLDGAELLPDPSLGGTHCTKHQSYQRIQQDSANNKWYVWDKEGKKSTYTPLYIVTFANGNVATFRWALTTVQDTNGNTVTYNYWTDPAQNCYLDNITYNGYVIKFWREARPDPISFANGVTVGHTNFRLKTIEVSAGSNRIRAYKLSYTVSASTQRSLLKSVQEFGSDAAIDGTGTVISGTSLPAQVMTYNPGGVGFPRTVITNRDIGSWNTDFADYNADVNGDGKDDHLRIWNSGGKAIVQVSLSNGSDYPVKTSNIEIGSWNTEYKDSFVDVNADGKADLVRIWDSGGKAKAQVNLSNGTGYPTQASNIEIGSWNTTFRDYFADVNGDGKTDLVRIWNHGDGRAFAQVNLSDGTGYPVKNFNGDIGGWNPEVKDYIVDVNGDGKADLVRIWNHGEGRAFAQFNFSTGTGFSPQSSNMDVGGWNPAVKDFFIDVNGDGKADLVRIWNSAGKAKAQINLSTGFGFPTTSSNVEIGAWNDTTQDHFADINGDGKPDIIRIWNNNGSAFAQVNLFDGVGYGKISSNQSVGSFNSAWRDSFVDVDGDGRADFLRIWNNGGNATAQIDLASRVGGTTPPDLLTAITNGVGGSTAIGYAPSTDWPSQFAPRGGSFPTVAQITVNDGRGKSGVTTYSYSNAKFSVADKMFMGFQLQEAVIDDLGTYIETFNRQTVQSVGEAEAIYTKNNTGQIYGYTTYTYNEGGNGVTVPYTSLVGATSEFELNLGTVGRENRSRFTYDVYGNQTQIIYDGDVAVAGDEYVKTISYAYNPSLYLMDLEQSEQKYSGVAPIPANKIDESIYYYDGASSTFSLPTKGNLTRSDTWNNQTGGYVSASGTFDSYGNQTSITDTRGATSTTIFDPIYHQLPLQSTNALGQSTTAVWDYVKGVTLSTTDAAGRTTLYSYDTLSRPVTVKDSDGNVTTTQYIAIGDPNNQRVRKTIPDGTADGLWSETYSDGLGREYKTVREGFSDGVTYLKESIYNDADEHPQQVSLWYQSGTTPRWENYQYDGLGRMVRTTHADGSFATVSYGLDAAGKPCTTTTDELGHQRTVWIDTTEHVLRVMEKNGGLYYNTYRTYDVEGRLLEIQDTNNNLTTYTYNSLGQVTASNDPNRGASRYTLDEGGLVLSETDAKGQTTFFTYDILGRIKTKTAGEQTTSWYYDEAGFGSSTGELTRIVYPEGSESFFYNNLGQVTTAVKTIGTVTKTVSTTYDSAGRVKTLTYPDGETVSYAYGADGALFSVAGYVDAMVYGPNGELIQVAYSNGTLSTFAYDPDRLWLNSATVSQGTTLLYTAAYTYNALQQVTSMSQGTPLPQFTSYHYDDLGRLLSVSGAQTQFFTYDAVGNILSNSLKGSYGYTDPNHPHAVTSAGTSAYSYDANGNMQTSDEKRFSWDAQDRLSSVQQGGSVTAFRYGAAHNRIAKTQGSSTTLYFSGFFEEANGSPTQYYYAGSLLVAKKDAAGTKTWYHADRLGSTRLMTNLAGAEVRDYDYRPFGEVLTTSGTVSNERGFTGQIADAETGLMYYNARYYDAVLGRFISADNAVQGEDDPQDLNAYSYCGNNPVNSTDPTGHYRVFAGLSRYVTWSKVTVSRSITIRVPYVIIYPTFDFYWRSVSISKTITWWWFGWHQRTATVTIAVPALRLVWHVRRGVYTFHRTIRISVLVPHVHFRAIYRDVVVAAKKIYHKAQHAFHTVKRQIHRAARHVASAARHVAASTKRHVASAAAAARHFVGAHAGVVLSVVGAVAAVSKKAHNVVGKINNAPNTAIGLAAGMAGWAAGGERPTIRNNAIVFANSPVAFSGAITLGNTIIVGKPFGPTGPNSGPNFPFSNGTVIQHEQQHTYQGEALGMFYLPSNILGLAAGEIFNHDAHGPANWNEVGPQSSPPRPW